MRKIIILGDILCTDHIQGISRYAYETIKYLDKYVDDLDIYIVYPDNSKIMLPKLKNIQTLKLHINEKKTF